MRGPSRGRTCCRCAAPLQCIHSQMPPGTVGNMDMKPVRSLNRLAVCKSFQQRLRKRQKKTRFETMLTYFRLLLLLILPFLVLLLLLLCCCCCCFAAAAAAATTETATHAGSRACACTNDYAIAAAAAAATRAAAMTAADAGGAHAIAMMRMQAVANPATVVLVRS